MSPVRTACESGFILRKPSEEFLENCALDKACISNVRRAVSVINQRQSPEGNAVRESGSVTRGVRMSLQFGFGLQAPKVCNVSGFRQHPYRLVRRAS